MAGIRRLAVEATRSLARIPGRPPARSLASATAVQYEFYEDDGDWEEEHRDRLWPAADASADAVGRGVQWVFMGSPGVQKRVYAARISRLLEVPYISMGSLVRQELNPRSSLYKQIASAVNEGKLVPEDVIFALLSKRLEEGYHRGETGFILDGIPRTRVQAEILDEIADIDLVVNFKCMKDCLVKSHLGSGICSYCRKSFTLHNSESTSLNPCLATRSRHCQLKRSNALDTEGISKDKMQAYNDQNRLLEDYYRKQRKLLDVQVAGGPAETWQGLLAALNLQQLDSISFSQKLMACRGSLW